jgi:hypothetical protein
MRVRRSCLSVAGSSPRMLAKASGLRADEVVIDLDDAVAAQLNRAAVRAPAPVGWRLEALRARAGGHAAADLAPDTAFEVERGEMVAADPELARLTLDVATAHTEADCDHLGPVCDGDVLHTELHVEGVEPAADGRLVDLRALVSAHRLDGEEAPVVDWRFVALVA